MQGAVKIIRVKSRASAKRKTHARTNPAPGYRHAEQMPRAVKAAAPYHHMEMPASFASSKRVQPAVTHISKRFPRPIQRQKTKARTLRKRGSTRIFVERFIGCVQHMGPQKRLC
jgi:hypothetical protein